MAQGFTHLSEGQQTFPVAVAYGMTRPLSLQPECADAPPRPLRLAIHARRVNGHNLKSA